MALITRWWRRRSLRARLTIVTSAGLAITLGLATVGLLYALRASLTRGLDDSARQAAVEVAALVNGNRLPDPVPVGSGTITIQVLDAQGRITDVSPGADRLVPILSPAAAATAVHTGQGQMLAGPPLGMPSLLRVVAVGAKNGQIVIAAVSFAQVNDSLAAMGQALVIGVPVLFGLLALVTWLVTGYALRPIAALSRGAARVTATGVPRDLPVPPARDEVRSLAVTLNDMLSRLAAAQQRQRDLVSDTAHELRSPISSIRTQLEVALDHPDSQDWGETARDVYADTLRLARLAEDLLLLARLDEPAPRPRTTVDLAALSRSAAERYGTARVPVVVNAPSPCLIPGDPGSLDRLLINLIDNAVRYARKEVTVAAWHEGEWAVLTVTDDGPGIAPEDAERAFGRFARLDDARSRDGAEAGGAGLGLAIVRATAQAHGGSARLESACPGLRVVVRLPCLPGAGGSDDGSDDDGAPA